MKNRFLVTMGLIAALMATGCAGNAGSNQQPDAAQDAETVQVQEQQETTDAGQESAEPAQEAAAPQTGKYESSNGWTATYNPAEIEAIEDDAVYFSYIGEAEGKRHDQGRHSLSEIGLMNKCMSFQWEILLK